MALRDQPYIPLYIQDFLTDEKLMECSASATGVYIRVMCLMHKSEDYGTILLKQKDKQTDKQIKNFALKLAKFLPYDLLIIESALDELIIENVLQIEGDLLLQKRMVKDNEISAKRATAGANGGKKTQGNNKNFASNFAKAKNKANTEYENENENEVETINKKGTKKQKIEKLLFLDCVNLSPEEHEKLFAVFKDQTAYAIEILNNYKQSTGKKYKSDYHALIGWVQEKIDKENLNKKNEYNGIKRTNQTSIGNNGIPSGGERKNFD
jgi:hypothetical protein